MRINTSGSARRRKLRASWRDTVVLISEFRKPLIVFFLALVGCGMIFTFLAGLAGEPLQSPLEGIYLVLGLTFLQPIIDFPRAWYLELFFFIMPILGVGILAQGLADFGVLLFNRRARGKEWEMAIASTYNHHIVLIGLGHLGFRVVKTLHDLDQDVVVIELNPKADLVSHVRQMDIPVIEDDGTREIILTSAGIQHARAIILCTQNDSLNLQMAVKARGLNPKIKVIVRIFDDDFASALQEQFGFIALSATGMAAPLFAASAAGVDISPPITIEGQLNSLARIDIPAQSKIVGCSLDEIENGHEISVVLIKHNGKTEHHPQNEIRVTAGDMIVVMGSPEKINALVNLNQKVS